MPPDSIVTGTPLFQLPAKSNSLGAQKECRDYKRLGHRYQQPTFVLGHLVELGPTIDQHAGLDYVSAVRAMELLRQQMSLPVLRVSTGERASRAVTIFDLQHGDAAVDQIVVESRLLGIPLNLSSFARERYGEPYIEIPEEVGAALKASVAALKPDPVLWFQFGRRPGVLPLVPWERLLAHWLSLPILRLPYFSVKPQVPTGAMTVALCASTPRAKNAFETPRWIYELAGTILNSSQKKVVIHVFVDQEAYEDTAQHLATLNGPNGSVRIHNPEEAAGYSVPPPSRRVSEQIGELDSPWLRWIRDSLREGADVVQFLCHGYLSAEEGALALAESPLINADRQLARFVGTQQLVNFSTQIGAWSMGFTSPPHDYSRSGLRYMLDATARAWAGPVFLYELNYGGSDRRGLSDLYRLLADEHPSPGPQFDGAISMYCHPNRLGLAADVADQFDLQRPVAALSPSQSAIALTSPLSAPQPSWAASGQRLIEQSAARLMTDTGRDDLDRSPRARGAFDALSFVRDVIQRHAAIDEAAQISDGQDEQNSRPNI
jgi:hypothetical protein